MHTILFIGLLMLTMNTEHCQNSNQNPNIWHSPDRTFTVDVPLKLEEIQGEYDELDKARYKSIKLFGSSQKEAESGGMTFQVIVLDLTDKAAHEPQKKLAGLEFLIGGDDEKPTLKSTTIIAGLRAREMIFGETKVCQKGLIIDGGRRVFILGVATNCENLTLPAVKRFFESFRLTKA